MAGQLRRGIMHYANGDQDVIAPPLALGNAAQQGPRSVAPIPITPSAAPLATAPLWSQTATPSAFSQILQGQFGDVQQNPNVSPVQAAAAALGEHIQTAKRAADLVSNNVPSPMEWAVHMFTGNPASGAVLQQRQDTANKLGDPLVQQHLATNPDHLAQAEQDPHGFAALTTDPDFIQYMRDGVKNYNTASQPIMVGDGAGNQRPVTLDTPKAAADVMSNHGVPADAAAALTHGHQLSREEFINSLINTPTKVIQMLFGAQLGHVPTVHDVVAKTYFDAQEQQLAKQRAEIAEMEQRGDKREAAEIKRKKADLAKGEQAKMEQMGAYVGGYQRQFPMNLPPP